MRLINLALRWIADTFRREKRYEVTFKVQVTARTEQEAINLARMKSKFSPAFSTYCWVLPDDLNELCDCADSNCTICGS
jgi:hypothetical protein